MNDEIINAACCVFPDGTVFWLYEPTQDLIARTFELWRESLEDPSLYARCSSGVVTVRMPRSKFQAITAYYPDPIAQGLPTYDAPSAPATDTGHAV